MVELYFSLVLTGKLPKFDMNITKKLIQVSEFFKNKHIVKTLIDECLVPNLDKMTCLRILRDYFDQIKSNDHYFELVSKCIEIASKNIFFLIHNNQEELARLSEDSLEEIIGRYFESVKLITNIDHSIIMRLMIKLRNLNDIFELLEHERKRSISNFEKICTDGLLPFLTWKISSDLNILINNPTEEFNYEHIRAQLSTQYEPSKDILHLSMRIIGIENKSNANNNSEIIFSLLSNFEFQELNFRTNTTFHCMTQSKKNIPICRIQNFSKLIEGYEKKDLTLKIYFELSHNFSSIFLHICKNFYEYYSLVSLAKIPKSVLNLILRNKCLNVRNQDEVLFSIITYSKLPLYSVNNMPQSKLTMQVVEELMRIIAWDDVTLDGLLEFILSESKLLLNSNYLQEVLITQFRKRFKDEIDSRSGLFEGIIRE